MVERVKSLSAADALDGLDSLSNQIGGELCRLHAYVGALQLAANADEGRGSSTLHWCSLIEVLAELLPDVESFDSKMSSTRAALAAILPAERRPRWSDAQARSLAG